MAYDFTGKIINNIYVKERDNSKPKGASQKRYWICICPICHNEFSVRSDHLLKPINMCTNCNKEKREDLTGKTFYNLTVDFMLPYEKYKRTKCSCTCNCGTTGVIVQANHLKAGEIKSCGCLISNGEEEIAKILQRYNIPYEKQKIFENCKNLAPLRFDFYLPNLNLVIEYNGIQHYQPVDFFGGQETFKQRQQCDEIKKEYCKKNNINFLEISYKDNINNVIINNIIKRDSLSSVKTEG